MTESCPTHEYATHMNKQCHTRLRCKAAKPFGVKMIGHTHLRSEAVSTSVREIMGKSKLSCSRPMCVYVCVCVCVRERERER